MADFCTYVCSQYCHWKIATGENKCEASAKSKGESTHWKRATTDNPPERNQ